MTIIRIRLRSWLSRESLAEIHVPEDSTVAQLRSTIRDAPEMAVWPERMFSRWHVEGKYLKLEIESAMEEAMLTEIGLRDESTVFLEAPRAGEEGTSSTDAVAFNAAVVADQRCDIRAQATHREMATLLNVIKAQQNSFEKVMKEMQAQYQHDCAIRQQEVAAQREECASLANLVRQQQEMIEALRENNNSMNANHNRSGNNPMFIQNRLAASAMSAVYVGGGGGSCGGPNCSVFNETSLMAFRRRVMTAVTAASHKVYSITYLKQGAGSAIANSTLSSKATTVGTLTSSNGGGGDGVEAERTVITGFEAYFSLPSPNRLSRPFHFPNARVGRGDRCLIVFSHTSPSGTNGGLNIGFAPISSPGHQASAHRYFRDVGAYMLAVYGTNVWRGGQILKALDKISDINPKRKIAILFDLSFGLMDGFTAAKESSVAAAAAVSSASTTISVQQSTNATPPQLVNEGTASAGSGVGEGGVGEGRLAASDDSSSAAASNAQQAPSDPQMPNEKGLDNPNSVANAKQQPHAAQANGSTVMGFMRVFLSSGGEGAEENMVPFHDERILVEDPSVGTAQKPSAECSPVIPIFIPCANMLDKGTVTVHAIHMNDDVPRQYLAHIM